MKKIVFLSLVLLLCICAMGAFTVNALTEPGEGIDVYSVTFTDGEKTVVSQGVVGCDVSIPAIFATEDCRFFVDGKEIDPDTLVFEASDITVQVIYTPTISIASCNLSFRDSIAIKYAVKSNRADVKLLIWTAPMADYTLGTESKVIEKAYIEKINGTEYYVFDYTDLAAKQMTDVVYARACVEDENGVYYSNVAKYSILQYAYNKLGKTGTATSNDDLKAMLGAMLEYGAAAQKYFGYNLDRLATMDFYQVKLSGGLLDDGCKSGLYLPGDQVTLTAPATQADGKIFWHWVDASGNIVSTNATFALTVGSQNNTYTPVYTEHNYVSYPGKEPTCTEDGYAAYKVCSVCGDNDYTVIPAKGHSYVSYPGKEPTCTEDGYAAYEECSACGDNNYTVIPAGHSYVSYPGKDPTCTEDGYKPYQSCSACGDNNYTVIPAGHNYVSYPGEDATCTTDGHTAYQMCSVCGDNNYTVIPAGHKYDSYLGKDATCTASGYKAYRVCSVCGDNDYTVIPAKGHSYVSYPGKDATCTASGYKAYRVCSACGDNDYTVIPANGHKYVSYPGKDATCTEDGYKPYKSCSACGDNNYTVISARHNYIFYPGMDATCEKEGYEPYQRCSGCGDNNYVAIPKKEHSYISYSGKDATCTEDGWTAYKSCSACGDNDYTVLPATGHVSDGEKCIYCGIFEYKITVNYLYKSGGVAAVSAVVKVWEGSTYSIASPTINGYVADITVVSGTATGNRVVKVTYAIGLSGGSDESGEDIEWDLFGYTPPSPMDSYTRVDANGNPDANGEYILFGEYPQTIKANNVTIRGVTDSRGYYLGSDGAYYAKVTATPYASGYTFSTGKTVSSGAVYYFKVEPIRWRILSENGDTALILCDSIIANKRFDDSSNNYAESEIRAWLNAEFYNAAFDSLQRELILITTVDNSVASTGGFSNPYVCEDTNDKVFLLSCEDVTNADYGFVTHPYDYGIARQRQTSDYTRATGAHMSTSIDYYGNGLWWLRSPDYSIDDTVREVNVDGYVLDYFLGGNLVYTRYVGVVPALQIRLK